MKFLQQNGGTYDYNIVTHVKEVVRKRSIWLTYIHIVHSLHVCDHNMLGQYQIES